MYKNNDEYKQRLSEPFKDNDKLNELFTALKKDIVEKEWNGKKFVNDDETGPLRSKNNKDMIFEIFEQPLIKSLKQLHENKGYIKENKTIANLAKEILNYVCAYDYSEDNDTITKGVITKMIERRTGVEKGIVWFFQKLIKLIIKMSLPNKENLKDL